MAGMEDENIYSDASEEDQVGWVFGIFHPQTDGCSVSVSLSPSHPPGEQGCRGRLFNQFGNDAARNSACGTSRKGPLWFWPCLAPSARSDWGQRPESGRFV